MELTMVQILSACVLAMIPYGVGYGVGKHNGVIEAWKACEDELERRGELTPDFHWKMSITLRA